MYMAKKTAKKAAQGLRLTALTIPQAAKVLSAAAGRRVSEEMLREALEAGAPGLLGGRVNLIEFMAWLERELASA